ncbi:MAG: hypothetical protein U1E46_08330 [Hyphomicrobiales bacterium]
MRRAAIIGAFLLAGCSGAFAQLVNDYPTDARADYVFACMKANGETRDALERCSCSIDVIASLLPYDKYVEAETFLSLGQVPGERGAFFKHSSTADAVTSTVRRAQAEAEIRCF